MRASLVEHAVQGPIVYHANGGQMLLRDVPGLLRVRAVAPMVKRLGFVIARRGGNELEASNYIHRKDENRIKWNRFLYGVKSLDDSLNYDVVVNLEHMDPPQAADLVAMAAQMPQFKWNDTHPQEIADMALATRVKSALMQDPNVRLFHLEVQASGSNVDHPQRDGRTRRSVTSSKRSPTEPSASSRSPSSTTSSDGGNRRGMETTTADVDTVRLDEILKRYDPFDGNLIAILHEVQGLYNYLPEPALEYVSEQTGFSLQRIFSIATFYNYFSLEPRGRHLIHVCTGTACHVQGAQRVLNEFENQLEVKEGGTTEDMEFNALRSALCGSLQLGPGGHRGQAGACGASARQGLQPVEEATQVTGQRKENRDAMKPAVSTPDVPFDIDLDCSRKIEIRVCVGTGGLAAGAFEVIEEFREQLFTQGFSGKVIGRSCDCKVGKVGCRGFCAKDVLVDVELDGVTTTYQRVTAANVRRIVTDHILLGQPVEKWLAGEEYEHFHSPQQKILLSECGTIDPEDIDAYVAVGGYEAIKKVIGQWSPERVVEEIKQAGLRGRGRSRIPHRSEVGARTGGDQ